MPMYDNDGNRITPTEAAKEIVADYANEAVQKWFERNWTLDPWSLTPKQREQLTDAIQKQSDRVLRFLLHGRR